MTNQSCTKSHTLQASSNPDIELSKVRSFDKQTELYNVLHSEDPSHYQRLWMAGFLKHVGYTIEEICDIIDKEANWNDYNAVMTYNQVRSIFKGSNEGYFFTGSLLLSSSKKEDMVQDEGFIHAFHRNDPVDCQIMSTHAICHYKKCDSCPLANSVFVENRRFCEVIPVKCSECPDSCRGKV